MPRIKAQTLGQHQELVWDSITASLRELLAEGSYDQASMGQIAQHAGLARNTLYNYAKDKSSLLSKIIERATAPFLDDVERISTLDVPPSQRVSEIISTSMTAFADPVVRLLLEMPGRVAVPRRHEVEPGTPPGRLFAALDKVIRDGVESGDFQPQLDSDLAAAILGGMAWAAAERMKLDDLPPSDVASVLEGMVLAALRMC